MDLDIRYVAGLFDGEGWITVNVWEVPGRDYIRYQLFIGIGMSHYPLMATMKQQFGGLLHRNDSANKRDPVNRINYQWRLSSKAASGFLQSVRPWLNIKGEEADLAIELQAHISSHGSDFKYRPHMRPELYAYRQKMVDQIRVMKRRRWDVPNGSDPIHAKVEFSA
jgi:hypothetical protein